MVKITDFGIASVLGLAKSKFSMRMNIGEVSAESSIVESRSSGTVTHMPPEQFINYAACDQRSDVYAFGIVLYQMVTGGKLPFFSHNIQEMYRLHSYAQVPWLDSALFPMIQRCLEKKPERRYETFEELRADLELLLRRQTGEEIRPPTVAEFEAWELNNKGTSLEKVGRFDEAIVCYDKALDINSHIVETWFNKGNSLVSLGHFDEALKCHEKALEINPRHQFGWTNKAVALHALGRFEEANGCCDRALEINPKSVSAWSNKAASLGFLGSFDEAMKCVDKALEIDPLYVKAWINKGVILRRKGRFDEALMCYSKALDINPEQDEAWSNRGVILSKKGHLEEALMCYNKALEFNPLNGDYWFNRATIFLKTGRFEEAIKNFNKALEINPKHRGASINKMLAEQEWSRRNGARAKSGNLDDPEAERKAEMWALKLENEQDYHGLANMFNSTDYAHDPLHFKKKFYAKGALKRAGSKAVDVILEETAKEGVGCSDLAELLANIGDARAIPLLKRMLDRGCFSSSSQVYFVEEFVKKYPDLHGKVETSECAVCGKNRPVAEMRRASERFGSPFKYFCSDTCWSKRGRIVGSKFPGAKNCPYYSEGICRAGGDHTCSLSFGSYDTTCFVYKSSVKGSR
jgi:tetratricopeptide (TPR) repeat protein